MGTSRYGGRRYLSFHWRVFTRAVRDTVALANAQGAFFAIGSATIGVLVLGAYRGKDAVTQETESLLAFVATPIAALVVCAFIWNLVATPARLAFEREREHAAELDQRDQRILELEERAAILDHTDPRVGFKDRLSYQIDAGIDVMKGGSIDYQSNEDWAIETVVFLQESVGDAEAQEFARWVWGRDGSEGPRIGFAIHEYLYKLSMRADDVALRRKFDPTRWSLALSDETREEIMLSHKIGLLETSLEQLNTLFVNARGTMDRNRLAAIETAFQSNVEPVVKRELESHRDLLALFYDETGFQQGVYEGPPVRKSEVTNFLERRSMRLKDVIAALREQREG